MTPATSTTPANSTKIADRVTAVNGAGTVHVVLPDGVDDPARPSGGNFYDRRICDGLGVIGWTVVEHGVPGHWPLPDVAARAALAGLIAAIPDGAVILVDGLIASAVPDVLVPESVRLRLVVLVHMPLGVGLPGQESPRDEPSGQAGASGREQAVLSAAAAVLVTSNWTRTLLLERYTLWPNQVHVAVPGVEAAEPAAGTAAGAELLCVAAVTPGKGHDVLLAALATIADLPWRCRCVGSLTRDPGFVQRIVGQAVDSGIGDRVLFTGPRTGVALADAYGAADVLVLASRGETYGMVVTEALARGLPVIATAVGGLPEALGVGSAGQLPGLLVPPGNPMALAAELRNWLGDPDLRHRLRQTALERRGTLSGWPTTAQRISRVLAQVSA